MYQMMAFGASPSPQQNMRRLDTPMRGPAWSWDAMGVARERE